MGKMANSVSRVSAARPGGLRLKRAAIAAAALALATACSSPEAKFDRYMKSGAEYLEQGKLGIANVQYLNALKIKEDNVEALTGLAKIAEQRANYEQMFGLLQRISNIDPTNVPARLNLAKLFLLAGDTGKSMELVDDVLKSDDTNAEAVAIKAAVMFRVQNVAQAVELANRALELNPTSQEAVAVLASERVQAEDNEAALKILDAALDRDPKAAVLHILRVQVLSNLGRADDIDAAYLRLIEEYPENAEYRRLYATMLIERERFADARAELEEVARLLPRQREAKLDVVRMDYRIGGRAKAEETLRGYIAEETDDVDLQFALGAFLREEGEFDAANGVYHKILEDYKKDINVVLRAKNELSAVYMLRGDRAQAEKLIGEILAAEGDNTEALIKRAGIRIENSQAQEAIGDLRVVLGEHPESVPARLLTAAALEATGDVKFAESEFAQAVEASGRASQPSLLFAKFLVRHNKRDRALKVLTDSVAAFPKDVDTLKMLAALRLDSQDWRGAEEVANILRAADGADADVSRILGAAYNGLKDYAGAIEVLSKENDRAPLAAQPLVTLIQAYVDAGRTEDAEKFLADTVAQNPKYYEARVLLAQVQRADGRTEEALATLQAAIEMEPLRSEAYESAYGAYVLAGRRAEAGDIIEQAVAAVPDNDGLQILRADYKIAVGDADAAIAIYETILARRPGDPIVANNIASLLSDRDDQESIARAVAAAAPLKNSDNPYFIDTYGWALYRSGRASEGIEALEKAVRVAPALVEARYHLGVALLETGQVERGKAELKTVIAAAGASPAIVAEAQRLLEAD